MPRPQAVPTVQIDDERVIVTEWRFAPGAETGWHRHGHDYVVVPMTDGELLLETPEGNRTAALHQGRSYNRRVGVEHNVINNTDHEVVFVEIELKSTRHPEGAPHGHEDLAAVHAERPQPVEDRCTDRR